MELGQAQIELKEEALGHAICGHMQRRNDTAATDGFRRGDGGRRREWARLTTGMGGSGP